MRKETLITALVFFVLGSIAGYVFRAESSPGGTGLASGGGANTMTDAASPAGGTDPGAGSVNPALPPGHPALSDAAVIKTFEDQAARNPQDPNPPLQLANYLYDHGDFNRAVTWYQKATQLDAKNVDASTDLGTCYFNLGRYDEALKQFQRSLTIEPRHQPTLYNLVVVNMEGKHDYKAADQFWQTLHRLNPSYPKLDELRQKLDESRPSGQ